MLVVIIEDPVVIITILCVNIRNSVLARILVTVVETPVEKVLNV